ncbi:MAG: hypothetical protein KDI27_03495 [Gammaproteobacteria bacterium]|nr:hypothetical protein [Gammaproteobacteria bacterium]MCP5416459.1 hypothetical protein [Chromatiaceae bacterium]
MEKLDHRLLPDSGEEIADLLENEADPSLLDNWEKSLAEMFDVVAAILRREGVGDGLATRMAGKAVHGLAKYHGGRHFYLPKNEALDRAIRDRLMFHRWMSGKATPNELAAANGVSYTRVMQILAKQRRLWWKKGGISRDVAGGAEVGTLG